jgi:hypothetical protein
MEYSSTHSLTSALDEGEWSASRPFGKNPQYPLYRRLGGPQSRSGRGGEEKYSLLLPGIEPRSSSPTHSYCSTVFIFSSCLFPGYLPQSGVQKEQRLAATLCRKNTPPPPPIYTSFTARFHMNHFTEAPLTLSIKLRRLILQWWNVFGQVSVTSGGRSSLVQRLVQFPCCSGFTWRTT